MSQVAQGTSVSARSHEQWRAAYKVHNGCTRVIHLGYEKVEGSNQTFSWQK